MATPISHHNIPTRAPIAPVTARPKGGGPTPEDIEREQNDAFTSDDEAIEAREFAGEARERLDDEGPIDLTDEVVERDEDPEMLSAREPSLAAADPDQRARPTDEQRRPDEAQQAADERDG